MRFGQHDHRHLMALAQISGVPPDDVPTAFAPQKWNPQEIGIAAVDAVGPGNDARKAANFKKADEVREHLKQRGRRNAPMDPNHLPVDGRNPTPKKPRNDDSPVNANKQWLPMVSKWCEMDFATIHSLFPHGKTHPNAPS